MSGCENCDKATRDDAHLCDDCGDRAARWIGEIPWLDEELETTIGKIRGVAYDGLGGGPGHERAERDKGEAKDRLMAGAHEIALPINIHASKKRDELRHALVMAVRFCDEEGVRHRCPDNDLPDDNLIAMSRWLLWRVDGLTLNDMGPQVLADVVNAARACKRAIDTPPERRYAGPCPECKRDLYHRPDAVEVNCSGCGQRWNVAEMGAWMRQRLDEHLADRLVTVREGCTLLGRYGITVPLDTIESWKRRGRLTERGENPRVYRWDDLRDLAIEHATRRGA